MGNLGKTMRAQKEIKQILIDNKFKKQIKDFCKIKMNKQQLNTTNEALADDLELLSDFGVNYDWERMVECKWNLRIVFGGHFGDQNKSKPPSLIVLCDESSYCHFYSMFDAQTGQQMDFTFELKKSGLFTQEHIEWLKLYKSKTIQQNGQLVSIVNVYNFYHDAVKLLIKNCQK